MQSFIIALMAMAGAAVAAPADVEARNAVPCPPNTLYSVAQCCATDVLGLVDLDCQNPLSISNFWDFETSCSNTGKTAFCCSLPVAGQGVLCNKAIPQ